MSQSTPTRSPSRRRVLPVETPGSARSTTSNTDRSTLVERVEELDLEVHDLRRQIAAERARRRTSASTSTRTAAATLSLSYMDPSGRRGAGQLKQVLAEKLRDMDDDALTALLTASSAALGKLISGSGEDEGEADGKVWMVMDAALVPSKSVGVEGTGSGSDIDRRFYNGKSRTGIAEELSATRHAANINSWLKDRQRRLTSLVDGLVQFSHLEIDSLSQTEPSSGAATASRTRSIRIAGNIARLFPIDISLDVVEDELPASSQSPQIRDLQLTLPPWLVTALDTPHKLYSKLLARNDLPAILLMLRTMVPLLSLRRNLFSSLLETYTDLARDHVRSWEAQNRLDFTPFHPPSSSSSSTTTTTASRKSAKIDEALGKSLILPVASETFMLTNKARASLELHFAIRWNRFGHAYPHLTATPHVPANLADATTTAFLQDFQAEFHHLLKVAVAQNAIVGLPDHEAEHEHDEQLHPSVGRWGIAPAIHATIKAFFSLHQEDASASSSMEQE
ncbi:hypothetical protein EX895_000448 [Sporisorium graminicola]|uniref:Uncharacterized protein n=1 Tax=Sporisorium graminicola TaxID=280036 RepID=A0A4U7L0X7_9BASI|nr:hypothetical protein EX895_000448 [Sporisorium graminicola]TKY90450.1 hypothetical protein EX895_000448 [Sporisorium graminicola]